jgi:hypothetical protein
MNNGDDCRRCSEESFVPFVCLPDVVEPRRETSLWCNFAKRSDPMP